MAYITEVEHEFTVGDKVIHESEGRGVVRGILVNLDKKGEAISCRVRLRGNSWCDEFPESELTAAEGKDR